MKHNNLLKKMMASAVAFSMMAGSLPLMPAADEAVVQSEILPETSGPQTDAPASSQGTSGSETQVLPSQDSKLESQDLEQSGAAAVRKSSRKVCLLPERKQQKTAPRPVSRNRAETSLQWKLKVRIRRTVKLRK